MTGESIDVGGSFSCSRSWSGGACRGRWVIVAVVDLIEVWIDCVFKLIGGASAVEPSSIAVDGKVAQGREGGVSSFIFLLK